MSPRAEQLDLPLPERRRRRSNRDRVRQALADGAWHTAAELVEIGGLRFGARVHELRHAEGCNVEVRVEGGASAYRLARKDGAADGMGATEG